MAKAARRHTSQTRRFVMPALLDTCVLLDVLRGDVAALRATRALAEKPYVCAVSLLELYAGVKSQREEARVDRLLAMFYWAPIDTSVYRHAGHFLRHYHASHGIDAPDALIAATVEHHGLTLATLNVKHFPMLKGLKPAY